MVKIGQLCLHMGVYDDKQIISSGWINEMVQPRMVEGSMFRGMKYGYLWWIIDDYTYAAIGNSGNVIYVNKKDNFVVGLTAYFKPTVFNRIDFIKNCLEKAFC